VDVANVMGSRPDGWWRDRPGAAVRLHAELASLASKGRPVLPGDTGPDDAGPDDAGPDDAGPEEFVMVLEGATKAAASRIENNSPVRVVKADGSGDDAIVALVQELSGRRVVVTADRELRRRCEAAGAEVFGPSWLIGLVRGQ
jgi:8-oxo-dGTP diphosphatase